MSGIQTVLNKASSIDINRRKVVGVQITRNQIPRTSLIPTRNPWQFTVEMPMLTWWNNRSLVESLDYMDRYTPQTVNFSDSCLSWMFRYQGPLTSGQINQLVVSSFSGDQLTLSGLNAAGISNGAVMFEPNDLIQIGANPYPFTVVNRVTGNGTNSVTFTMNRPNFLSGPATNGASITVGPACTFNLFCTNMPTYKIVPGGYKYHRSDVSSGTINKGLIQFSEPFILMEWVGGAA